MSVQGQLAGRPWSVWTSPPSQPPVRVCPTPPPTASEDVMKLPREDMQTFGRCPAWDAFILVTCDKCDKIVKMEAFESHMTLRHGSKSEKSAYHRVLAAKAAASLEACEVKLAPSSTATNSNSSSGGGNTPTVGNILCLINSTVLLQISISRSSPRFRHVARWLLRLQELEPRGRERRRRKVR